MVNAARGETLRRRVRGRGAVGCTSLVALAVALVGCSSSSHITRPLAGTTSAGAASPSPSESPSPVPASEALAQYRAFWTSLTPASRAPASQRRDLLAPYAADPELKSLLDGMRRADGQGEVFYGQDVPRPTVQTISEDRGVAVIRDCQDSSHAGNAKRDTGRPVTVGVARHPVVATMHLMQDGQWRVVYVAYPKGSC